MDKNFVDKKRDLSIDVLRGIACVIVLLIHIFTNYVTKYKLEEIYYALWGIGKFAVCIFFVLSAYFAYCKMQEKPSKFFVKRLLRVYIPFAMVAILGWTIGWIDTKDTLISVLELNGIDRHLWTVAVELKFYFFFMFFMAFVKKFHIKEKYIVISWVLLSIICVLIFPSSNWPGNAQGLQWYIPVFSLGIIIAIVQSKLKEDDYRFKKHFQCVGDIVFLVASIIFILRIPIVRWSVFGIPMDSSLINKYLQLGVLAGLIVFGLINGKYIKVVLGKCSFLSYIGKRSYSIYLVHYIVFEKLSGIEMSPVLYLISCFVITFFVSFLFYELVEVRLTSYVIDMIEG